MNKVFIVINVALVTIASCLLAGCHHAKVQEIDSEGLTTDTGTATSTGGDADSDTDADMDTDADADMDTDADTDTDTDTDTDADTDTETHSDSDEDSDSELPDIDVDTEFINPCPWEAVHPIYSVNTLMDLWVFDENDIYTVGVNDAFHYTQAGGETIELPVEGSYTCIWASSKNDIYAVGSRYEPDNGVIIHFDGVSWSEVEISDEVAAMDRFTIVWGSAADNVVVATDRAYLHFNGTKWTVHPFADGPIEESIQYNEVKAIWGTAANNIYSIGPYKKIYHFDGAKWSEFETEIIIEDPTQIWGTGPDDFFIAGRVRDENNQYSGPQLNHKTENGWESLTPPVGSEMIYSLWGSGNDNLYIVANDTVLHFDGDTWTDLQPYKGNIVSIAGSPDGALWTVGTSGIFERYKDNKWEFMNGETRHPLEDIYGFEAGDEHTKHSVIISSDILMEGRDKQWQQSDVPAVASTYKSVWANSPDNIFAVAPSDFSSDSFVAGNPTVIEKTADNTVVHYIKNKLNFKGKQSCHMLPGESALFSTSSVDAEGNNYYQLEYRTTEGWQPFAVQPIEGLPFSSIWASGAGDIYGISQETGAVYHFDGNTWEQVDAFLGQKATGVWGNHANEVYVILKTNYPDPFSAVYLFDGQTWTEFLNLSQFYTVTSIWSLGPENAIFNTTYNPSMPYIPNECRIWHAAIDDFFLMNDITPTFGGSKLLGFSPTSVIASSKGLLHYPENDNLFKYDGTGWALMPSSGLEQMADLYGYAEDDFYVIGTPENQSPNDSSVIQHFDGTNWSVEETPDTRNLTHFCGQQNASMDTSFLAYNNQGTLIRYRDGIWSLEERGFSCSAINDIWGTCPSGPSSCELYFACNGGGALRYKNNIWENLNTGVHANLHGVWGRDLQNVYWVGERNSIIHFDGEKMTALKEDFPIKYNDIWGNQNGEIMAVGDSGVLSHFDGTKWTTGRLNGSHSALNAVHGTEEGEFYVSSRYFYYYDKNGWRVDPSFERAGKMWAVSNKEIYQIGYNGRVLKSQCPQ